MVVDGLSVDREPFPDGEGDGPVFVRYRTVGLGPDVQEETPVLAHEVDHVADDVDGIPPKDLIVSMEVDLYPPDEPGKADLIDRSIGEDSPFHETFGYYAHGVGPETAVLPRGWKSRIVELRNERTSFVTGLCLHPVDIAAAKLAAGRET